MSRTGHYVQTVSKERFGVVEDEGVTSYWRELLDDEGDYLPRETVDASALPEGMKERLDAGLSEEKAR